MYVVPPLIFAGIHMSKKAYQNKQLALRNDIVAAAQAYAPLSGSVFLYVFDHRSIEVRFPKECFLHLTGVKTLLPAKSFYKKALDSELESHQFFNDDAHPYHAAKLKLPCLKHLADLTDSMVVILFNHKTRTFTYTLSVTNLQFTLGLVPYKDRSGVPHANQYVPMTLRPKDKAVNSSSDGACVDFIFKRDAAGRLYDCLTFADPSKALPEVFLPQLDSSLRAQFAAQP